MRDCGAMPGLEAGEMALTGVVDSAFQLDRHVSCEVLEIGVDVAPFGRNRHWQHVRFAEADAHEVEAASTAARMNFPPGSVRRTTHGGQRRREANHVVAAATAVPGSRPADTVSSHEPGVRSLIVPIPIVLSRQIRGWKTCVCEPVRGISKCP